jgi:segregation and condensation protein A
MSSSYEIKLSQFEGPFDLLLFFIERDELDIYDIPISKITDEFLSYIQQMEILNIDMASEFIVVAASLMRIKAKMLLPRKEVDETGQEVDPRQELVNRLLEYKRFKEASADMQKMEEERGMRHGRGNITDEIKSISEQFSGEAELHSLNMFKLLKAFEKVMGRYEEEKKKPKHTVVQYAYTIVGQKDYITNLVKGKGNVPFEEMFFGCENRIHAIFNFLALLELIQQKLIHLIAGTGVNNFWISEEIPPPVSEN